MLFIPERLHAAPAAHNRATRRYNNISNPDAIAEDNIINTFKGYNGAYLDKQDNSRNTGGKSVAKAIFQGERVGVPFVQALRDVSIVMHEALGKKQMFCDAHQEWLQDIKYPDLYYQPINGTSLGYIEGMSLPLEQSDHRQFLELYHSPFFDFSNSTNRRLIREAITYLITEPLLYDQTPVPSSLHPLRQRLTTFFDYYAHFLRERDIDRENEGRFAHSLLFGGPEFGKTLGTYLIADMGLTPSSTIKLFRSRLIRPPISWFSGSFMKSIQDELQDAYQISGVNSVPEDLHLYLKYDSKQDESATKILDNYYKNKSHSDLFNDQDSDALIDKLRKLRRTILRDLLRSEKQFTTFSLDGNSPVTDVAIGLRSNKSRYHNNFLFVLFFSDQKTHLTLELDGEKNRLYGLPPELVKRHPHIDEIIIRDVIGQIVQQVELKNHSNEGMTPTTVTKQAEYKLPLIVQDAHDESEEPVKVPKRKRLKQIVEAFTKQPELPTHDETYQRTFTVHHDEALIRSLMRNPSKADLQQIMDVLARFEKGGMRIRKLVNPNEGSDMYRITSGRYRVKIHYEGGNSFTVTEVVQRKEAYEN